MIWTQGGGNSLWWGCFGLNCAQMVPGADEWDFGLLAELTLSCKKDLYFQCTTSFDEDSPVLGYSRQHLCRGLYNFGQRGRQIELISNGTRSSTDEPFRGSFQKTLVKGKRPVRSSVLCVSVSRDQGRWTSNRDNLTCGDWKKGGKAQFPHCARGKKRERGGRKLRFNLASVLTRKTAILGDPGADKGDEGKSKRAEKYIWNEEK